MLEGQFVRTDRDMFTAPGAPDPIRLHQLRDHFSPEESQMFGIDRPYDRDIESVPALRRALDGLAATMATTLLFAGVGLLGIPSGAFA
jgi:hypothetical protein